MTYKKIIWLSVFMIYSCIGISQRSSHASNVNKGNDKQLNQVSTPGKEGQPDWISKGCEAFWGDKSENRLCAIGVAAGSYSKNGQRINAERQARSKIEKILEPILMTLIQDYANTSHGHDDFGKPPDMERVRNLATSLTQRSVLESRIVSVYTEDNNQMYVLVSLDTDGFRNAVQKLPNLSDDLRKELFKHIENGFKEINKK